MSRSLSLGRLLFRRPISSVPSSFSPFILASSFHRRFHSSSHSASNFSSHRWLMMGSFSTALLSYYLYNSSSPLSSSADAAESLPEYTLAEIGKHRTKATGIWVTYRGFVYDVTDFVEKHPGGMKKIMLAAGGALEPFWAMYQQHASPHILKIIEPLKIGRVANYDHSKASSSEGDPYAGDPERHPALRIVSAKPFNAETPPDGMQSFITPNELFFVRNHLPVPKIDEKTFKLTITGEGIRTVSLSLDELQTKFKKHTVTSAIQCTGNRRTDFNQIKLVKGLDWQGGAISNATFSGVRLRDVLEYAGMDVDGAMNGKAALNINHVLFEGVDRDPTGQVYGASIPVKKAIDYYGDVIIAFEMNGEKLPIDHGYPLRVVVPGYAGARQVKWLSKITTSQTESLSHWQQFDYKSFPPNIDWHNVDWKSAPAIQEMPVQSGIAQPSPSDDNAALSVHDDHVEVKGWAWSGGGKGIIRVDVSVDGGKNWQVANLERPVQQSPGSVWSWTLWTADIAITEKMRATLAARPPAERKLEIVAKATDETYSTQPESAAPIWNLRGVLNNSWHRVNLPVKDD